MLHNLVELAGGEAPLLAGGGGRINAGDIVRIVTQHCLKDLLKYN